METTETNGKTGQPDRLPNGRFGPGNQLGGRPKGSRHKITEAFLRDLSEVWQSHGRGALLRMIEEEPGGFVRAMASLVPKEAKLQVEDMRTLVVSLVGAQMDEPEVIEGEAVPMVEEQPLEEPERVSAPPDGRGYATRS